MKKLFVAYLLSIMTLAGCSSREVPTYTGSPADDGGPIEVNKADSKLVVSGIGHQGVCTDEFINSMETLIEENKDLILMENLNEIFESYKGEQRASLSKKIERLDAARVQCTSAMIEFIYNNETVCKNTEIEVKGMKNVYKHDLKNMMSFCKNTNSFQRAAQNAWDSEYSSEIDKVLSSDGKGRLRKVKDSYRVTTCDSRFVSIFEDYLNTYEGIKSDYKALMSVYPTDTEEKKRQRVMLLTKIHSANKGFRKFCGPLTEYIEIYGPCKVSENDDELLFYRRVKNLCDDAIKKSDLGPDVEEAIRPNR